MSNIFHFFFIINFANCYFKLRKFRIVFKITVFCKNYILKNVKFRFFYEFVVFLRILHTIMGDNNDFGTF